VTGSESLENAEVLVDDDAGCRPVAGIPQFAGSWPETEVARVGAIGLAALRLGTAHGLAAAAGAGSSFSLEEMIRELGLSGDGDPAHDIAQGTYIDAYTRTAFPGIPPPPDWQQHGRYLRGQLVVTLDGRRGRLNGWASRRSGDPRILFDGTAAAVTVPRREVTGPVVRVFRGAWEATGYVSGLGMGTLHDGDVLWMPGERTAAVMYQVWPFAVGGTWFACRRLHEWQGGPDAFAAADNNRYVLSVAMARAMLLRLRPRRRPPIRS
jgi:hypothetical protein